jgi:hypothetical protein
MEDENDKLSEEDILKASEAYITFVQRFGEYVKEMDPELWGRARAYAADFTKIDGVRVELVDIDEEEEENDTDDTNVSGAD